MRTLSMLGVTRAYAVHYLKLYRIHGWKKPIIKPINKTKGKVYIFGNKCNFKIDKEGQINNSAQWYIFVNQI